MENLDILSKQYELNFLKLDDIYQTQSDKVNIDIFEMTLNIGTNGIITESESDVICESIISNFAKKTVDVIGKIIQMLVDFFKQIKNKIHYLFLTKEEKMQLQNVMNDPNVLNSKEKIEIFDDEKNKKMLNEYVKEMAKLEREVLNLQINMSHASAKKSSLYTIQYNKLIKKIDDINEKYDKKFLDNNDATIKLALKDAIRFTDKQLDKIKIDFDEVEKGSTEILKQFKKDANNCDVPIKLNLLQKISNSVGTRIRKHYEKSIAGYSKNKHHVLKLAAKILVFIGGGIAVSKGAEKLRNRVMLNPMIQAQINQFCASHDIDPSFPDIEDN